MSKTNSSRPGNAAPAVVYSGDVTTVAQLAQAAPIAPPQNLEAEESVLGAMMVSESTIDPVLLDVRVAQEENCYPMIPPGQAARDMVEAP